jgi:hypothetical protein
MNQCPQCNKIIGLILYDGQKMCTCCMNKIKEKSSKVNKIKRLFSIRK